MSQGPPLAVSPATTPPSAPQHQSQTRSKSHEAGLISWSVFKFSLGLLKEVSEGVPFNVLKPIVGGLSFIIEQFEDMSDVQEDIEGMSRDLLAFSLLFKKYQARAADLRAEINDRLAMIQPVIDKYAAELDQMKSRGRLTRFFASKDNLQKTARFLRNITSAVNTYQIDTITDISVTQDEINTRILDIGVKISRVDVKIYDAAVKMDDALVKLDNANKKLDDGGVTLLDVHTHTLKVKQDAMLKHLLHPVETVSYNDAPPVRRAARVACKEQTRMSILESLHKWARDPTVSNILWLNGLAGTGKTTIAMSFCSKLQERKCPSASFFCVRDPTVGAVDSRRILPTLAYGLAQMCSAFRSALYGKLAADETRTPADITSLPPQQQFQELLAHPLKLSGFGAKDMPQAVLVVDGLDEIDDPTSTRKWLRDLVTNTSDVGIKIFLTSRPEPHIEGAITSHNLPGPPPINFPLHDLELGHIHHDIKLYLSSRLDAIAHDHRIQLEPTEQWPTPDDLNHLVKLTGSLFLFASTLCNYIDYPKADPRERLHTFLNAVAEAKLARVSLDNMYDFVLIQAQEGLEEKEVSDFKQCLAALVCLHQPLSVPGMATLLDLSKERVRTALLGLHSVVRVPSVAFDNTKYPISESHLNLTEIYGYAYAVTIFHISFREYLTTDAEQHQAAHHNKELSGGLQTASRAKWFVCQEVQDSTHKLLAGCCLAIMDNELEFNVTQSKSSHFRNRHVQQSNHVASECLEYACQFWAVHLHSSHLPPYSSSNSLDIQIKVWDVLRTKFLFWLEVMSVAGRIHQASMLLIKLMLPRDSDKYSSNMKTFLKDAIEFITNFEEPISQSAPHIYLTALPFTPSSSKVSQLFQSQFSGTLVLKDAITVQTRRPLYNMQNMWRNKTPHRVAAAFSQDGRHILSQSDGTIQVWDVKTGERGIFIYTNQWKEADLMAFAFSLDGKKIACAFEGRPASIRVWYTITRQRDGMAMAVTERILSIAFSPDGKLIACGTAGGPVYIWDVASKRNTRLDGQPRSWPSVTFSLDGKYLVAASQAPDTIMVWDVETWKPKGEPIQDNVGNHKCIAISPNGKYIAIGSQLGKIAVWKEATRVKVWDTDVRNDLWSHYGWFPRGKIWSIAFSPDGKRLVSSSSCTIRVWNVEKGEELGQPIRTPVGGNCPVAFSPDGNYIISGAPKHTIRFWDASAGPTLSNAVPYGSPSTASETAAQQMLLLFSPQLEHAHVLREGLAGVRGISSGDAFVTESEQGEIKLPGGEVLFYLPSDLRRGLWWPRTKQIFGVKPTILDLSRFHHGTDWVKCYTPDNAVGISSDQNEPEVHDAETLLPGKWPSTSRAVSSHVDSHRLQTSSRDTLCTLESTEPVCPEEANHDSKSWT